MLREEQHDLDITSYELQGLDLTPTSQPICYSYTANESLVTLKNKKVHVPFHAPCPLVRALGEDRVLVVNCRVDSVHEKNAWVVNHSGDLELTLSVGDDITEVVVYECGFIVGYGDEGVFGCTPPSQDGLVMFSWSGSVVFGYHSYFGKDGMQIGGCYCASATGDAQLVFVGYGEPIYQLVLLDLVAMSQRRYDVPRKAYGANAVTSLGNTMYFQVRSQILKWGLGDRDVTQVGSYDGRLRGLSGGRFLGKTKTGYSILHTEGECRDGTP